MKKMKKDKKEKKRDREEFEAESAPQANPVTPDPEADEEAARKEAKRAKKAAKKERKAAEAAAAKEDAPMAVQAEEAAATGDDNEKEKKKSKKDKKDKKEKAPESDSGSGSGSSSGYIRSGNYIEHDSTRAMNAAAVKAFREEHNITGVFPEEDAMQFKPIATFDALYPSIESSCAYVKKYIQDKGFAKPSPIQAQCWPPLLAGRDAVGTYLMALVFACVCIT